MKKLVISVLLGGIAVSAQAATVTQESTSLTEGAEHPLHFAVKSEGKWGVVNARGEFVIPAQYDDADVWTGGMVRVRKDGVEGVVGLDGTPIIPMVFRRIENFGDRDFTYASVAEGTVIIDRTGKVILGPGFQTIYSFDSKRSFLVSNGRVSGVVTLDCEWLLKPEFSRIGSVKENGLALAVTSDKRRGFVDARGNWAIAPDDHDFEDLWDFDDNGLAGAKSGGKWGHINAKGDWVIEPFATGRTPPFFYGDPPRARAKVNGKYGLIDMQGRFVVPAEYDFTGGGGAGVYAFTKNGKVGAFDYTGKIIIPFQYDEIGWAMNGVTVEAKKDGRKITFDLTGKEMPESEFEWTGFDTGRGWRAAQKDGKWGAINEKREWVLAPKFDCVGYCFRGTDSPPVNIVALPSGPSFTSADIESPREQGWCRKDD